STASVISSLAPRQHDWLHHGGKLAVGPRGDGFLVRHRGRRLDGRDDVGHTIHHEAPSETTVYAVYCAAIATVAAPSIVPPAEPIVTALAPGFMRFTVSGCAL